ncbi:receptor-type tyrosine-protein phosphatase delta-like isoform X2 [Xenia sp. Carnegie-2017]|uniref:receptor-type tyrosine-protein phosphatase delta-like isoform X2 n=1 Tax=Xenia sp. Carnegie-2017 TaxID=2897299 RepID=UPI001F046295|nr:receptor-type tyrosine-protein phosphatase delta-like isoform X2 [Xenia sp. Carnegie-2017]
MMTKISQFLYTLFVGVVLLLSLKETNGFFIKHVQSGKCIYDTGVEYSRYPSINPIHLTYYLNLTKNCFDSTTQFKFHQSGSILKPNRRGCLVGDRILQDLFLIYEKKGDIAAACNDANALTQTFQGGIFTSDFDKCAVPPGYIKRHVYMGIANCNNEEDQRFHFGAVTCAGQKIADASCSNNQYMVIKVAEYRGLRNGSSCGLSYDYSCSVDVTCDLKNYCDGERKCDVSVDDYHFSSSICPGLDKYLYFEYQCNDTSTPHREICNFENVHLSQSILPNKGVVDVITKFRNFTICNNGLLAEVKTTVCNRFGYPSALNIESWTSILTSVNHFFTPGNVACGAQVNDLSQCSITQNNSCSQYLYVTCHICKRPLLNNKHSFPNTSFSALSSTINHSAKEARISSGSSWCAPAANGTHYLELKFQKLYAINTIVIFGDSVSPCWVSSFYLNATSDLINWESVFHQNSQKVFPGNKNAYSDAAISNITGGIRTRALRIIPLSYTGQPCLRTEVCGGELHPNSPTNLHVNSTASRYVTISWVDPQNVAVSPSTGLKNPLTKFKFILRKKTMAIFNFVEQANVSRPYKLSNLIPNTMYTVEVFAGNSEGFGDPANASFHTNEDVPDGPPLNVTVAVVNSSSLSITWKPPDISKRNGKIINYTICITRWKNGTCSRNFTTTNQSFIVNDLKPATTYYISVLASTIIGRGNYSENEIAITNELQPEKLTNFTEETLTFSLKIPVEEYEFFYIIAMEGDEKNPPPPSNFSNEDLIRYSTLSQPKLYIAAVLKVSGVDMFVFILGDGLNSSISKPRTRRSTDRDYNNRPLSPDTTYRVFQRVIVNDMGVYYSTDWSPAAKTDPRPTTAPTTSAPQTPSPSTSAPQTPSLTTNPTLRLSSTTKKDEGNETLIFIAAAAAAGIVLIIIFVIVAVCLRRGRKGNKKSKSSLSSNDEGEKGYELSIKNEAFVGEDIVDAVQPQVENNRDLSNPIPDDDDTYANNETIIVRNHFPVPLEKFHEHVKKLRQKNMQELKLEFEDLPNGQKCNWDIAKNSINSAKNRYGNAVTYDHSRVILSGDEKSDYINASFVDGKCEKYYIATQGPKPKTVDDFWRMIFEHKCSTIVMLTTLKEMGKVKCEKYWPDESNEYGEIKVTVTKTKTFADYVTRMMVVEKDGEQHKVEQFHYKSWPDYGVPRYPTQLLTFIKHFKLSHRTRFGPVVVHCSAGVGRTGVFIAIDKILDDLDDDYETNIDVFGFVEEMRSRRINMVQTADQYMFIHDTIVDHIQCGANEVDAVEIKVEISQLSKTNGAGKTGFEEKFERLQSVTSELPEELCEAALSDENKKKNRNPNIYPTETNRPTLRRIERVESSDYINACFVDGYLGKNYFIATQMPLNETINDFWRMVTQHECTTIVLLSLINEDEEEYPMFWPTKRATSQPYGTCTVLFDSVVKNEDIVVRKFIASPTRDIKEGRMVRMVQYLSWPNHGVPKDVKSLVNVLTEVEEAQRAVEVKGPVVVVCSDGAGRSGTYITISNLVDRVKIVQVMDVFQCIKLIRSRRPQFVETAEQFKFCYNAVSCVLESFDEYSNFTEIAKS